MLACSVVYHNTPATGHAATVGAAPSSAPLTEQSQRHKFWLWRHVASQDHSPDGSSCLSPRVCLGAEVTSFQMPVLILCLFGFIKQRTLGTTLSMTAAIMRAVSNLSTGTLQATRARASLRAFQWELQPPLRRLSSNFGGDQAWRPAVGSAAAAAGRP